MTNPHPAEQNSPREYITFRIGSQEFCIDIMAVREIRVRIPATAAARAWLRTGSDQSERRGPADHRSRGAARLPAS